MFFQFKKGLKDSQQAYWRNIACLFMADSSPQTDKEQAEEHPKTKEKYKN